MSTSVNVISSGIAQYIIIVMIMIMIIIKS